MLSSNNSVESTIAEALAGKVFAMGTTDQAVYFVPVSATALMIRLSECIYDAISLKSVRELPFTADELSEALCWLVDARVAYVSGVRAECHPRDLEYPAILGPVLATIGIYRDEVSNYTITPTLADEKFGTVVDGRYKTTKEVLCKPVGYDKLMAALRVLGVPTIMGLPLDKRVESDELYRIDVVEKTLVGTDRKAPAPTVLFTRALLEVTFLADLFGQARITYAALSSIEASLSDVVLRNVSGAR